jgi:Kef-type K+ transport system membrane component KefB
MTVDLHAFPLIAVILAVAAAAGLLATRLRQPLIVAFIGVGILVGPTGTGWVVADGTIELLARMGIAISSMDASRSAFSSSRTSSWSW